ncbi:GspE/PulE family protein [Aliidiomarina haloalkalitolerans]|uniref:MSHA biogenesis protein MshE n=1 Tax=Aliidiomarina haloalkalitolerans TaxID=859059 RepID=A0A432VPK6_9GAMM|nr:GspE/PulE family protein [Aliidiomarina haloalkalitolerans]RUO18075.1 MSHA biogenesis protein MshE [Aliidiomarina haloalkalitolerans]
MVHRPRLKMRLGDLLVHERVITQEQLTEALAEQRQSGRKLGNILIEQGYVKETQMLAFLSQQLGLRLVNLTKIRDAEKFAKYIPEVQARRHRALAIDADDDQVVVAMSDPADLNAVDAIISLIAPKDVDIVLASERQLYDAFDSVYRRTAEIEQYASQLEEEAGDESDFGLGNLIDASDDEVTVARLLKSIFLDAIQVRASDIHLEPDEKCLRIRLRVDGQLQETILEERSIAAGLVLRLELMSSLDISEKRLPQDGRFEMKVRDHHLDVRLSTLPTAWGEACVMRLLDKSQGLLSLEKTGMPPELVKKVRYHMTRPYGMILVTGPTGSGKTTTLYGVLSELNDPKKKIITVEDPVEYRMPRISQVQIHAKIGLTFARVLRTTLRQDPDIIMVGEMRDQETVEIGLRGAITGHLVLSTLHTNDAITSAMRLIDMGAAPYLVASALKAVLAQRLVRRICDNCKADEAPDEAQRTLLRAVFKESQSGKTYKKGRGCNACNMTGYRGRVGVFELLEIDEPMMAALRESDTQKFAQAAMNSKGFKTLAQVGYDYAKQGITSIEEVLSLVAGVPDYDEADAEAKDMSEEALDKAAEALVQSELAGKNKEQTPKSISALIDDSDL